MLPPPDQVTLGFRLTHREEKSHHWLDMILDHLFVVQVMDNLRRYPLLVALARSLPSKWTTGLAKKQTQFSRDKVKEYVDTG